MKKLLTTTMILGTVLMINSAQPAEAAVTSPIISGTDQSQVTPTSYHWSWHTGSGVGFRGFSANPGSPYHHYSFHRSFHHWR